MLHFAHRDDVDHLALPEPPELTRDGGKRLIAAGGVDLLYAYFAGLRALCPKADDPDPGDGTDPARPEDPPDDGGAPLGATTSEQTKEL